MWPPHLSGFLVVARWFSLLLSQRSLEIREHAYGRKHFSLPPILNNIAKLYEEKVSQSHCVVMLDADGGRVVRSLLFSLLVSFSFRRMSMVLSRFSLVLFRLWNNH